MVSFKFEVLYTPVASDYVPADNIRFHQLLKSLLPKSGYFMCQVILVESSSQMTYKTNSACFWGVPFGRVDHKDCPPWLIAVIVTGLSSARFQRCDKCSKLMYYVRKEANKWKLVTPKQKAARVRASSDFPMKYLSPASLQQQRNLI